MLSRPRYEAATKTYFQSLHWTMKHQSDPCANYVILSNQICERGERKKEGEEFSTQKFIGKRSVILGISIFTR